MSVAVVAWGCFFGVVVVVVVNAGAGISADVMDVIVPP
jgi:hypothetical protein